jgi:hypothetical protein
MFPEFTLFSNLIINIILFPQLLLKLRHILKGLGLYDDFILHCRDTSFVDCMVLDGLLAGVVT